MSKFLLGYTREPINNILYDERLAYSLHLALSEDGVTYKSVNHNSGVLFALATENKDGSVNPMSIKNPCIFAMKDGGYGVIAVRMLDGDAFRKMEDDKAKALGLDPAKQEQKPYDEHDASSKGAVVFWTTKDFLKYEEKGLICLDTDYIEKAVCEFAEDTQCYELQWLNESGKSFIAEVRDLDSLVLVNGIGAAEIGSGKRGSHLACEDEAIVYDDTCSYVLETLAEKGIGVAEMEGDVLVPTENLDEIDLVEMEGAILHNAVEIPDAVAERITLKLAAPMNVGVVVPESVEVSSAEELGKVKADLKFSDGTIVSRKVDWDMSGVDFGKTGQYRVKGSVHQDHYEFPIAFNRADPCVGHWNGKYYFIATNDADNNHTIYVREADTIVDLKTAEEHLILDSQTYEGIGGLLWAPEFHEINGKMYIFHAATPGEFFWEESHIMELREGGSPICREDWSAPRRIVRMDGSELCEPGKVITLDMTTFEWDGSWYVVWSQREFLPKDLGAWLYIAKLNPEKPWMLASEPVVLSKPDYGWGNNHTFVEEGPFALPVEDKLYVTFSAAAVDTSYVVSYLVAEHGADLLDTRQWVKNGYPILTSRSMEGEFGTGHNAYITDEDGLIWNTYHARPGTEGVRSSGVRRVHLDVDGAPMLDVTEELDLKPEFKNVETTVVVM